MYTEILVGKTASVINSLDKTLISTRGKIIDETRNTLKIETNSKVIIVPKEICSFDLERPGRKDVTRIEGREILGTIAERIYRF